MLTLSLLLLSIVFFAGCFSSQGEEETNDSTGKLLSFSYIYSSFRYRPFKYKLQRETDDQGSDRIIFKAEGYAGGFIHLKEEIEEAVLEKIVNIMEEEDIFAWDGFDKSNREIRDGFNFELNARFGNQDIRARGYMEHPEKFRQGHERLADYLLRLAQGFGDD